MCVTLESSIYNTSDGEYIHPEPYENSINQAPLWPRKERVIYSEPLLFVR